jgi:hypothetical protein
MASALNPTQHEFTEGLWPTEPPVGAKIHSFDLEGKPSLGKRASRRLIRFLIVFGAGVTATLVWQSHGDAIRAMVANSYPHLGWLAPQAAAAQTTSDTLAAATPAIPYADAQQFKAMLLGVAAVRQSVDQLAAQLAAGQQQMAGDIARLQAAQQDILDKISASTPKPAAAPARKPVPLTPAPPAPSSQAAQAPQAPQVR